MAAVPAPPPPPPPPPPLVQNENDVSHQPIPKVQSVVTEPVQVNTPEGRPGESALHPNQLREYSKKWSLAGDSGLLLYLNNFSQRIISRTSEIDKLVESLGNSTKGSNAKVHNTFNDFLMLSSNQFIENRVYEDEITEEKTDKENNEKQEKTREQLESEILPRYTNAVHFGFNVLEDAFITVEIKPTVDDDSDDDEVGSISAAVADPIIEPKDVYSSRPLPYLIGTAEFIHDETIGLVEVQSEDEDEDVKVENEESDEEEEDDEEEETSSSEDISEEESDDVRPQKTATKKSFIEESDESENDLFGEPKSKKKHVESDESEDDDDEDDEEIESEEEEPKNNFQAELASKLGLGKPTVADDSDENISNDVESIQEKKAKRTKSESKRGGSMSAETQSITSKKSHNVKQKRTKSIESRNSQKKSGSKIIQKPKTNQDDEDLFAPPQKDEFFDENNDNGPFAKKSGLFSGGGNSLFDEPEDDDRLFSDSKEKAKKKEDKQEKEDKKEEEKEDKVSRTGSMQRTTSSGKRIPAGAVSIFGDASGGLFGSPDKLSRSSSKTSSVVAESPPKKPPPVVKGLFDEDDNEDMFNTVKNSNNLDIKPNTSPRKKTLELEDEDDDLFGDKPSKVEPKKEEIKKKVPVGGVSMFGGMPPQLTKKEKSDVASISKKKGSGGKIFDGDNDKDNLFNKSEGSKTSNENKSEAKKEGKKTNVISLFDDDDEDEDDNGDDIFSGLSIVKSESVPPTKDTKIPKSSSKPSSLFDEEDDDLFAVPTSKSNTPFAAPKEDKPAPAAESASPVAPKKVVTKTEPTPSSATTTKPSSLFSGDGLFGEEDDLFVTKPAEKVKVHKKEEPIKKEEPTQSTKLSKAPLDPFGDDNDDDLFATSKPVPSKKTAKPSEKQPVKSSGVIFDDNQDDLFSSSKSSLKNEPKSGDSAESSKPSTVEDEVDTKPKKPAGAVSLFGGIDPFAAKSNLKKTEKSHILASDGEDDDVGLFAAKKKPLPPSNVKPKPTPKSVEKIEVENDPLSVLSGNTKPVVTKPVNIPKKSDSPSLHADTSTKKNSADTSPKKASSNIGKLQASLNFNPSALLPGAAPPKKAEPITVASFDQPPDLKILENVSKTRARGQAKRRPPTRRARNVTDAKDEDTSSNSIDGNKESSVSQVTAAEVSTTLPDPSSRLPHKTLESKKIAVTDIFNDDEDDLFSTQTKSTTVKTKQTNILDDDALSKDNPIPSSNEKDDNNSHAQSDSKELVSDQINKKTDISDDLFGTPTEHNKIVTSTTKKSDSITDPNDIFSTKVDKKKTEDNLFSAAITSSSVKSKETPSESHGDVFSTKVSKTETEDNLFQPSKLQDNIFDNNDDLFNVSNSKKQKPKEAVDDEDDLFATKPRKKEASKSKAKVVKKKTDDDLFGNSGSIFDDMPVASKDKKKKKKKSEAVDDIFSTTSSTDDIFASKKTKTKKKAEKSETKTKTSNISDDKPNIFDDPLNALGGN